MNILFITTGSGPDTTIGGSLLRTVEIAKRIQEKHRVSVLTTTGGKIAIAKYFSQSQIIEINTPYSDFSRNFLFMIQLCYSWLKILYKSFTVLNSYPDFNLIYLDSDGIWDFFPALLYKRRFPGVKIVSMNHHTIILNRTTALSFFGSIFNRTLQKIGRYLIRNFADAIFILNTYEGKLIAKEFIGRNYRGKIYFVRNGVDLNLINKIGDNIPKKYSACFFGFLRPGKGLYDIIPIWKKVAEKIPDASLVIIGGMLPQYKQYLIKQIRINMLQKNIIFIGYIKNKVKALQEVKKAGIFISPSHEEGWGIAAMECLALGLPGVVWNLETYRNILKSGVIKVSSFNYGLFSNTVIKLLKNNLFKKKHNIYYRFLKKYDWDNIAANDLKNFQKIVNI